MPTNRDLFDGVKLRRRFSHDPLEHPIAEWAVPIMLGLTLREEFKGNRLAGTAIELSNESRTGATQLSAAEFLEITYPTRAVLEGIQGVGPGRGRPIVVLGERGKGKSHLMAAVYHAVHDPTSTREWLGVWAATFKDPAIATIPLRAGMLVIEESLQRQRFPFLWDLLFARHPHGAHVREKWERMGDAKTDIPSDLLILELLRHTPTTLLLDEYQTWYDGLKNTKQSPRKTWTSNFIQILSEIAKEHPSLFVLVVCVRDGETDAYRQLHRVNPIRIDFKNDASPERVQDRRRMLLHRLFENRLHIAADRIEALVSPHVAEYLRLLSIAPCEHDHQRAAFIAAWPFAPGLLALLEDQVLTATGAQESRDLIRILASLFKNRGEHEPILTSVDLRLEPEIAGSGALLDSVANERHRNLRATALSNIASLQAALPDHSKRMPHLEAIMASLWLRSIAVGEAAGAEPNVLQADLTKAVRLDENAFQAELATIVENSFNIHRANGRLVFRVEENPQAKVMACARNDRRFVDGSDLAHLAKEVRSGLGGAKAVAGTLRVIVLPPRWMTDPWSQLDESERPDRWDDRTTILVLPQDPQRIEECLGGWLKEHLRKGRNTVRFLLPRRASGSMYDDRDLLVPARAAMKALEWSPESPVYDELHRTYQGALRDRLKKHFDRFAVLHRWNFAEPRRCEFSIETLSAQGHHVLEAIEKAIARDLFVPEDFEEVVLQAAAGNSSLGSLLEQLREPRAGGKHCIPWLGETAIKERVLRVCAKGKIALRLRGSTYLQAAPGEEEDVAFSRLRPQLRNMSRRLDEIALVLPGAVPPTGRAQPRIVIERERRRDELVGAGHAARAAGERPTHVPSTPEAPSACGTSLASAPTSQLNLIGKIESWGIGPTTPISEVMIRVSSATGVQLRELLKKLPDGLTYELSLNRNDR